MANLNEAVRDHELKADWGHHDDCAQLWPIWRAITRKYYPGQPICYFRCESLPKTTLVQYRVVNGVGAQDEVTLNSRLLCLPKIDIVAALLHCQVHIWQHSNGKSSGCGMHNAEFQHEAERAGVPSSNGRSCKVLNYSDSFKAFVARRVPNYLEPWVAGLEPPGPGRPTLTKWACECQTIYALRNQSVTAVCTSCEQPYRRN